MSSDTYTDCQRITEEPILFEVELELGTDEIDLAHSMWGNFASTIVLHKYSL